MALLAVRIDAHGSGKAATALLGDKLHGLLVTDAYAAYNAEARGHSGKGGEKESAAGINAYRL